MRALEGWKDILSICPVTGCLDLSSFYNSRISGQFKKSIIFLTATATKKFELEVTLRPYFTWFWARSVPKALLILVASANAHGMAIGLC